MNVPIGFYADDFTGASANLLEFHRRGLGGLLFVDTPAPERLAPHLDRLDVVGIAGISRSLAPRDMTREVRPALERLRDLGCRVVQYKICSTFDSSPQRGSFGPVLEVARDLFGAQPVPVVAAHPDFGRYTAFGHHFAEYKSEVHRLDRHPSMSRHPATPMREADLRRHLAEQTDWPIRLCDFRVLRGDARGLDGMLRGDVAGAVVCDALEPDDLVRIAASVWRASGERPTFAVSAHGLSAGLATHMAAGREAPPQANGGPPGAVDSLLVLSGSCTPRTAEQIAHARAEGWAVVRLPIEQLPQRGEAAVIDAMSAEVGAAASQGRNIVVYTAAGPDDDGIPAGKDLFERIGRESSAVIGGIYGAVLRRVTSRTRIARFLLAGGDTASRTMRALGVEALSIVAVNVESQEPLLRIHAGESRLDGAQVLLKAGQNGGPDYFSAARRGDGWA
ncbi:MAG TPA: four-carbon acid sugar kinase family protein [Azospirillaceae bacterium]|nr:four-carbon acid sugar kinase family protein [Azospirillaceae bacterium]